MSHDEALRQADELNGHVVRLYQQGKFAQAIPLAMQALAVRRKVLGDDHPDTATSMNNLGILLKATGDYAGARPYHEQALAVYRKALGDDHALTATSLNNLGELLKAVGDHAGARPYHEQALAVRRKALGDDHPDTATSLNNLGALLYSMGDHTGARPYHEQALAVRRKALGDDHPDTATSLNNLGMLLKAVGDYAGARPYHEQALAVCRKALGDDHPDTAGSLNNLGLLLSELGDYAGARPYHEQALAVRRKALGDDHPDTAGSLNNLGVLLSQLGDYAGARPYHEQALAVYRKALGDDHALTATSLNNLGGLLYSMADYAGARPYYEQALAVYRKALGDDHALTATSLNNLGLLLSELGDYAGARPYHEQALAVRRKALGDDHALTATSLNNLGGLLSDMRDHAGARPYYEQALAVYRKALGDDHALTATSLNNLGGLLSDMRDHAGARPYYEQALAVYRKALGDDHALTATSLNNLAVLNAATNRVDEAGQLMQEAAAIEDRMIGQVFSIGSESQRAGFLKSLQCNLGCLLSLVLRHLDHSPPAVRAALDAVLRRKALGAEVLAAQRDAVLGGRYPQLEDSLRELSTLRSQIARKTLAGPGPEGLQAHRQFLDQWSNQKERLEADLARQIPEMNLERKLRAADRRAVALSLDEGVALIEFVRFDVFDFHAVPARGERRWQPARYLAFILPAGEPDDVRMIDLGEAAPIDALIADFRSGITGEAETRAGRNMVARPTRPTTAPATIAGPALRAAVFDKLIPGLGGRTRLLLAPDGDLSRLPFEVLPDARGRLLLDQYQISYVGCGRDVLRFGTPATRPPAEPLVVADPHFDLAAEDAAPSSSPTEPTPTNEPLSRRSRDFTRGDRHFGRLPGTRKEGEQIGRLLGVKPWLHADALEARLKQRRSPRILHLATHGFFLADQERDPNKEARDIAVMSDGPGRLSGPMPENPLLRSGLALAGANAWLNERPLPPEAEDGLLTAEDVSGLDLLDTELVVLSACETGLGEIRTGEGVFGLRRSFVLAGAKALVMSLWKVPDDATRALMEDFYHRLLAGEGKADALRTAQQALRAKPEYADPYFWGAFICQGDPGPLRPPSA